ncbi:transposase [Streptomyces sp. NPDC002722]|uniref:transposase n=1 Tax=unclassified Streptomyces TaxID=2593676 RepID=UPI0033312E8A
MAPVSTWCADADIPEVRRLAATIDRWWDEIAAFIDTGHTNAKSEGVNRVIKLTARNAFGFRNATNQRLRTRCVTTRRGPWTPPHRSTMKTPQTLSTRPGTYQPPPRHPPAPRDSRRHPGKIFTRQRVDRKCSATCSV